MMKKSQILAALALAFALGVVTPVAGLVNNASAFTIADSKANPAVKGGASEAEVDTAIAAVSGKYPVYDNMVALYNVLNNQGTVVTRTELADAVTAITDDLAAAPFSVAADKITAVTTDGTNTYSNVDSIKNAVALAKETIGTKYDAIEKYVNAVNGIATNETTDAELVEALGAIYNNFGQPASSVNYADAKVATYATSQFKTDIETGTASVDGNPAVPAIIVNYSDIAALINNMNTATEKSAAYEKSYKEITDAYKAAGILTTAGQEALAQEMKATNPSLNTIVGLVNTPANTNGYDAWVGNASTSVRGKIAAAEAAKVDVENSEINYNAIIAIAGAVRTAVPRPGETIENIAKDLVSYVASEDPEDPTDPSDPTNPEEPGQTITTVTAGDVTVSGVIPEGVTLKVTPLNEKVAAFGENKYALYDIEFVDADGKKVDVNTEMVVVIKVPADINGEKAGVFYVAEDGKVSKVEGAKYSEGYFTFNVSHFSKYAIVENPDTVKVGDTGVLGSAQGTASTTISVVAGLATALTALGAGVVAYRNARRAE